MISSQPDLQSLERRIHSEFSKPFFFGYLPLAYQYSLWCGTTMQNNKQEHGGRWGTAALLPGNLARRKASCMAPRWFLRLAAISTVTLPSASRRYTGTAAGGKRGCRWGCKHLASGPELSIQQVGEIVWNNIQPVNMSHFASDKLRSPCWTTADGSYKCLPGKSSRPIFSVFFFCYCC